MPLARAVTCQKRSAPAGNSPRSVRPAQRRWSSASARSTTARAVIGSRRSRPPCSCHARSARCDRRPLARRARARRHRDSGLGHNLLSAGLDRAADRARARLVDELCHGRLLARVAHGRPRVATRGPADRPLRWTSGHVRRLAPRRAWSRPDRLCRPSRRLSRGLDAARRRDRCNPVRSGLCYARSGLSAHLLAIFARAGIDAATVVAIGALFGPAQVAARICELMVARRIHPLFVARFAVAMLLAAFALLALFGLSVATAATFAVMFGMANGLLTIARGAVPLALFGAAGYGHLMGRIGGPYLVMQAIAPLVLALVAERPSDPTVLAMVAGFAAVSFIGFVAVRRPLPDKPGSRVR